MVRSNTSASRYSRVLTNAHTAMTPRIELHLQRLEEALQVEEQHLRSTHRHRSEVANRAARLAEEQRQRTAQLLDEQARMSSKAMVARSGSAAMGWEFFSAAGKKWCILRLAR